MKVGNGSDAPLPTTHDPSPNLRPLDVDRVTDDAAEDTAGDAADDGALHLVATDRRAQHRACGRTDHRVTLGVADRFRALRVDYARSTRRRRTAGCRGPRGHTLHDWLRLRLRVSVRRLRHRLELASVRVVRITHFRRR